MAIVLGDNQYGKAETRAVRIYRDTRRHEIRDLNLSTALRGDFDDAHLTGDQSHVLPTDTQKNTAFAYAKERGIGAIEDYALALAGHFTDDIESVTRARVDVDEYRWERISVDGAGHPHAFVRTGQEIRSAAAVINAEGPVQAKWVVSGTRDLVLLKSTGSQFTGFLRDRYTTLAEATDRILATSLTARWRYVGTDVAWDEAFAQVRQVLLERFAVPHSRALQQTLWDMGSAVLGARNDIAEIRLSAPNRHHFLADLSPYGLDNPGEVFHADDRPYGLIQCAVVRDGAPDAGPAWELPEAFA
ncbi:MAG: urate oxidase [Nocardiopsaceae bacterium]|jgi:urate oxidase|nr:urate oxidase [Nocardiopsaceae bacterium]